jgi:excisionase family DNA binding protein
LLERLKLKCGQAISVMSSFGVNAMDESSKSQEPSAIADSELPMTVKEAAKYLGVSSQTVYLWVERKQIPHLRVMGRNIRFLKPDLETFRASFKQEMVNE